MTLTSNLNLKSPAAPQFLDSSRFIPFDAWRGVACLLVLAWHTGACVRWPPLALYGNTGVDLFFVLSGYLLFQPFMKSIAAGSSAPPLGNFYLRRFLRIYPPYLASLIVFILLRHFTHTNPPNVESVVSHIFLYFNYLPRINFLGINGVYWTLAIEIQFYLLLPLICMATARAAAALGLKGGAAAFLVPCVFVAVGLASRTVEVFLWNDVIRVRSVFAYLDLFGFGMLAVWTKRFCPAPGSRVARWALGLTGLAIFFAANDWAHYACDGGWLTAPPGPYLILSPTVLCLGAATLMYAIVSSPQPVRYGWWLLGLAWVGEISYSVYLYHAGIEFAVNHFVHLDKYSYDVASFSYALIATPPTLVLAWVMYRAVEKPAMDLGARLKPKRKHVEPVNGTVPGLAAVE